jgi:predicted dehydrogenase
MSAELAVGLVGCGRLAREGYVPALHAAAGVRLAAVADPDPARRGALAEQDVRGFADGAGLLAGGGVDAVVLATPAPAHLADAQRAAAAGVPTLVEKPPAPDGAEAAALAALYPAPWVGFNRRFTAGRRAVREALAASGRVDLLLELCYRRASWGAHVVGDEVLLDIAPHLVDLARWLSRGEVTEVRAATVTHDRAEIDLELERGRARIRCAADRPHRELVEARDERGRVLARHDEGGLVAGLRARLTARGGPHPLVASLTAQLEAFAATVRGTPDPELATAADGHAVMAVVDAARACAANGGRPVSVAAAAVT